MAKLKVYRTAIGFHDAYVAAPSQKAALEAWGSDKNLFAHGAAEIVDDPKLTADPLASPGEVIKRLRGTVEQQMAALPPDRPKSRTSDADVDQTASKPPKKTAAKPKPPPSRTKLEQADAALEAFEARGHKKLADLKRREEALARERKQTLAALECERETLTSCRDREAASYDEAIRRWKNN